MHIYEQRMVTITVDRHYAYTFYHIDRVILEFGKENFEWVHPARWDGPKMQMDLWVRLAPEQATQAIKRIWQVLCNFST